MSDLTYISNGFYTRFIPNTKSGEEAYYEIYKVTGDGAVRNDHLKATLKQLRVAGYTVSKSKISKAKKEKEMTTIMSELDDFEIVSDCCSGRISETEDRCLRCKEHCSPVLTE